MFSKIKYYVWGACQIIDILKATLLIKPKTLLFRNIFSLLDQRADIVIDFDGKISFYMRDFYDLLAFYETFKAESYRKLFFRVNQNNVNVIDIGAYNGDTALYASRFGFVKKVISIEPDPENYAILLKNIQLNHAKNITPFNTAISNHKILRLYNYKNRRQVGIHNADVKSKHFVVKGTCLAEIVNKMHGVIFVKCDAEGSEYEIFLGTSSTTLQKISRMVIEYHTDKTDKVLKLITHLVDSGMKVDVDPNKYFKDFGYIYARRG